MNHTESDKERFDRYKKILLEIIYKELPNCKVYLFGSRARNDHSSGSDIDLAVDMGVRINSDKIYRIKDLIEETTIPLNVDIVDFQTATGAFREEIEKDGILWKMPMPKVVDLTHKLTTSMPVHSLDDAPTIEKIRNLTDNKYNDWKLSSGMHVGTHIDGPGHFTDSNVLFSDVPVDKFVGKGVLIDARNKVIDSSLLNDLSAEEGLIVLILTGFDKKFGTDEYFNNHPVFTPNFAKELVKRKVKMVGMDLFSPDNYPFEVHKIFFDNNIFIIENLTNLESLLGQQFTVVALPLKTETDSALARVIAIIQAYY